MVLTFTLSTTLFVAKKMVLLVPSTKPTSLASLPLAPALPINPSRAISDRTPAVNSAAIGSTAMKLYAPSRSSVPPLLAALSARVLKSPWRMRTPSFVSVNLVMT
jgi:hypothetical protein